MPLGLAVLGAAMAPPVGLSTPGPPVPASASADRIAKINQGKGKSGSRRWCMIFLRDTIQARQARPGQAWLGFLILRLPCRDRLARTQSRDPLGRAAVPRIVFREWRSIGQVKRKRRGGLMVCTMTMQYVSGEFSPLRTNSAVRFPCLLFFF